MTQSAVNFTVDQWNSAGVLVDQTYDTRVFDFEVTRVGATYYAARIQKLIDVFESGSFSTSDLQAFKDNLYALNAWSKFKDAKYYDSINQSMIPQGTDKSSSTAAYNDLMDPYHALEDLGYTPADTSTKALLAYTMSQEMATQLERLNRLLTAVGYNVGDPTASNASLGKLATALSTLKTFTAQVKVQSATDPTIYTTETKSQFYLALTNALGSISTARIYGDVLTGAVSLQEVLMTDYISRGNELIFNEMRGLRDAINQNQMALAYLNSLQDLMNQKDPEKFVLNLAALSTNDPQTLVGNQTTSGPYDTYESGNFQPDLKAVAYFQTNTDVEAFCKNPDGTFKKELFVQAFSDKLSGGDPVSYTFSITQIITNLTNLITSLKTATASKLDESSNLVQSLQKIADDMKSISTTTSTDVATWVQDMTENSDFQTHLNNAITSSQSFNDTQRENLRSVMFVFEEFYKSATSLLSRITQLIEKMASLIGK